MLKLSVASAAQGTMRMLGAIKGDTRFRNDSSFMHIDRQWYRFCCDDLRKYDVCHNQFRTLLYRYCLCTRKFGYFIDVISSMAKEGGYKCVN